MTKNDTVSHLTEDHSKHDFKIKEQTISIVDESTRRPEDEVVHEQKPEGEQQPQEGGELANAEGNAENVEAEKDPEAPEHEGVDPEELKEAEKENENQRKIDLDFNFTVLNEHIVKNVNIRLFSLIILAWRRLLFSITS